MYVFAVLFLGYLITSIAGVIEVVLSGERYPSRKARFGPLLPPDALQAYLIPIDFLSKDKDTFGCSPVDHLTSEAVHFWELLGTPKGFKRIKWIALVERGGGCQFVDKVRAMQASGAAGVVVGDNVAGGPLIQMTGDGDVGIPSAFVMQWEYKDLRYQAMERFSWAVRTEALGSKSSGADGIKPKSLGRPVQREDGPCPTLLIRLFPDEFVDLPLGDVILIMLVAPLLLVLLFYIMYKYRSADEFVPFLNGHANQPGHPLSLLDFPATRAMLDRIPKRIHSAKGPSSGGWAGEQDTCAICLDDFEDGEELRELACRHEFHLECIDPWLLGRKRTCPLCKADACPPAPSVDQGDGEGSWLLSPRPERPPPIIVPAPFVIDYYDDYLAPLTAGAVYQQSDPHQSSNLSNATFQTAQSFETASISSAEQQDGGLLGRLLGTNHHLSDIELARTGSPRVQARHIREQR